MLGRVTTTNDELFARAQRVIPGGVNSPVRAFGSVGGTPYFVARAEGAHVWDVEGRRYIDLVQSYGAIIAGHAHPAIVEAVQRAAADGTSYGAPDRARGAARRGDLRAGAVGASWCGSCRRAPRPRCRPSASPAGYTGRRKVVKFAGNYHGHGDLLLAEAGSGLAALGLPGSAGVTEAAVADTVVAPVQRRARARRATPPASSSSRSPPTWASSPPVDGLPRRACGPSATGSARCSIFDEVITGFRVAYGGAQERTGVTPDLTTLRQGHRRRPQHRRLRRAGRRHGSRSRPLGPVYQAGTLSGNPLATAAGLAALDAARRRRLRRAHAPPPSAWPPASAPRFAAAGIPAVVPAGGARSSACYFGAEAPVDYPSAQRTDTARYAAFFHAMLDRGVALAPGAYEVMFPGLAHTDDVIDEVGAAARRGRRDRLVAMSERRTG